MESRQSKGEDQSAAKIEVEWVAEGQFSVRVIEKGSESSHRVTLRAEDFQRMAGRDVSPQEIVRRSFEFLLEREPKEYILAEFDLSVINRYFPEYEREIKRRL